MSESIRISLSNPVVEADQDSAADLLCGLTATLDVISGAKKWRDEHFPVLELAIAVRRRDHGSPLRFSSMCMEEDPVLVLEFGEGVAQVTTYDGTRIDAPDHDVEQALEVFVQKVESVVRDLCGRSIADVEECLS